MTCTSCGANLSRTLMPHKYKCPYCGSIYYIKKNSDVNESDVKENHNNSENNNAVDITGEDTNTTVNSVQKTGAVCFCILIGIIIFICLSKVSKYDSKSKNNSVKSTYDMIDYGSEKDDKLEPLDYPEHEYMKQILELIFNKPFENVTKEEICSITYLDISYSHMQNYSFDVEYSVNYSFEDYHDFDTYIEFEETIQSVIVSENELNKDEYDLRDFSCLKGLNYCPMLRLYEIQKFSNIY